MWQRHINSYASDKNAPLTLDLKWQHHYTDNVQTGLLAMVEAALHSQGTSNIRRQVFDFKFCFETCLPTTSCGYMCQRGKKRRGSGNKLHPLPRTEQHWLLQSRGSRSVCREDSNSLYRSTCLCVCGQWETCVATCNQYKLRKHVASCMLNTQSVVNNQLRSDVIQKVGSHMRTDCLTLRTQDKRQQVNGQSQLAG